MNDRKNGWIIVTVLFATMFLIWGPVNASSVFFLPVVQHFGWSRTFFSLLVATAPLAAGFSSPGIGSLMDRYGERWIMIAGATMVGLSFLALSRADSAPAFFAIFVTLGIGITASTIIPAALVITRWFSEQRGVALGIAFAGIPLGGTAMAIVANQVVNYGGFRAGYIAMAIPILFLVIPLLAMFIPTSTEKQKTEAERVPTEESLFGLEVSEALRARSFWMIAIAEVLFATARVGLRVHLVPFLTGLGYSPTRAAEVLSATFVFSAIGTFAIGRVVDKLGGRTTLGLVFVGAAGGIAALLAASHWIAVAAFVLIFGLAGDTPAAIFPIAVTESLGAKRLGGLLGLLALCRTVGFAFGPVIAGRIFDRSGSYTGALLVFVASEIVSMLVIRATLPFGEEKTRILAGQRGQAEPATSA
jgi:MFS family permease